MGSPQRPAASNDDRHPRRHQWDQLEHCLLSIEAAAAKLSAEILIVDSDPEEFTAATRCGMSAQARPPPLLLGEYNHSRLLNAGVAAAQTEAVCLLSPSIRAFDGAWLGELLSRVAASDAGAVGLWCAGRTASCVTAVLRSALASVRSTPSAIGWLPTPAMAICCASAANAAPSVQAVL